MCVPRFVAVFVYALLTRLAGRAAFIIRNFIRDWTLCVETKPRNSSWFLVDSHE